MDSCASRALFFFVAMFFVPWQAGARAETQPEKETSAKTEIKTEIKSEIETAGKAPTAVSELVERLPHKLIYPGDILYPVELAKTGMQGEVKFILAISVEGKLLSSKMVDSSKSTELDKNALSYVNGESWRLPENLPKDRDSHYLLSVIFNRDSILTINLKTCAELNTDLAYFRSVRPEDPIKNVPSLELIASLFTVQLIKTQGAAEALKYAKAVNAISDATLHICTEKPEALLIETYVNAARQHAIKF